jgi:hypothetical protein
LPNRLLEKPFTADGVVRWKRQVLDVEADLTDQGFEERAVGTAVMLPRLSHASILGVGRRRAVIPMPAASVPKDVPDSVDAFLA